MNLFSYCRLVGVLSVLWAGQALHADAFLINNTGGKMLFWLNPEPNKIFVINANDQARITRDWVNPSNQSTIYITCLLKRQDGSSTPFPSWLLPNTTFSSKPWYAVTDTITAPGTAEWQKRGGMITTTPTSGTFTYMDYPYAPKFQLTHDANGAHLVPAKASSIYAAPSPSQPTPPPSGDERTVLPR